MTENRVAGLQRAGRRAPSGLEAGVEELVGRTTWLVVKDGRIVEGWDTWNLAGMLETLR